MSADPKQRFRDLLKTADWTQAEAARQLCMSPGAVSQIIRENSPTKPSPTTLRLLEVLVELKQTGKLVIAPGAPEGETPLQPTAGEWESNLIAALRQLPPPTRIQLSNALIAIIQTARQ